MDESHPLSTSTTRCLQEFLLTYIAREVLDVSPLNTLCVFALCGWVFVAEISKKKKEDSSQICVTLSFIKNQILLSLLDQIKTTSNFIHVGLDISILSV